MGCDIHAVMQKKVDGGFEDVSSEYDEGRHYALFAWLADVRNGVGFAGITTGSRIDPISDPRGFPPDFEVSDDMHPIASFDVLPEWRKDYKDDDDTLTVWMGDHSHSWLSWQEILDARNPLEGVMEVGVISSKDYLKWDHVSRPDNYVGMIYGPNVDVCEPPEVFDPSVHTHVRVSWPAEVSDFGYFLDEIRRLVAEHGEGRMVFGFDS